MTSQCVLFASAGNHVLASGTCPQHGESLGSTPKKANWSFSHRVGIFLGTSLRWGSWGITGFPASIAVICPFRIGWESCPYLRNISSTTWGITGFHSKQKRKNLSFSKKRKEKEETNLSFFRIGWGIVLFLSFFLKKRHELVLFA